MADEWSEDISGREYSVDELTKRFGICGNTLKKEWRVLLMHARDRVRFARWVLDRAIDNEVRLLRAQEEDRKYFAKSGKQGWRKRRSPLKGMWI